MEAASTCNSFNVDFDDQLCRLEREGYCILNDAIPPATVKKIVAELQALEAACTDHGADNRGRVIKRDDTRFMIHHLQFENCPSVHDIITDGAGTRFLEAATGDNLICTGASFAHCKPGFPGLPMHTDFNPYAGNPYRPNNPIVIRALYYLSDLTQERSPLRLLPYSHLTLHKNMQFNREFNETRKDEIQVVCPAGTAVLFNPRMFHGVGPNRSTESRRSMTITFRPAWARPLHPVEEHEPAKLAALPNSLRVFFEGQNHSSAGL